VAGLGGALAVRLAGALATGLEAGTPVAAGVVGASVAAGLVAGASVAAGLTAGLVAGASVAPGLAAGLVAGASVAPGLAGALAAGSDAGTGASVTTRLGATLAARVGVKLGLGASVGARLKVGTALGTADGDGADVTAGDGVGAGVLWQAARAITREPTTATIESVRVRIIGASMRSSDGGVAQPSVARANEHRRLVRSSPRRGRNDPACFAGRRLTFALDRQKYRTQR
jgi:hypothetical protein